MSVGLAPDMPRVSSLVFRRRRATAAAVSLTLLCSGLSSCTRTQVALSITAGAAIVAGTAVGITLAVQHSHHTLEGCIISDGNGLSLRLSDARVYKLDGELADVKAGDKLKVHGSKVKKAKGTTGGEVFVVEKVNKNYGPCPANAGVSSAPAH